MKKILAIIAAIVFLCCACESSNEEKYIAQLEERIAALEKQLCGVQESVADTPLPQAAPSLTFGEDKEKSTALPSPQVSNSSDVQETEASPVLSPEVSDKNGSVIVYITKSGKKYHKKGCSALSKSCIPAALDEAISKGYTPCGKCNPP